MEDEEDEEEEDEEDEEEAADVKVVEGTPRLASNCAPMTSLSLNVLSH